MFNLRDAFFAFILVGLLLLLGRYIKQRVRWIQRLYLPESIVAGAIALVLGPGILGAIAPDNFIFGNGLFSESIRGVWSQAPGVFISIVFATLFLGETIPSPRNIWRKAAPQVVFGQSIAWGQYVIGIGLTLFFLGPLFGVNPLAGALIEIAFEGGHGTSAGMVDTLTELGFPEGGDLALGLATVGIVSGIVAGTALADWGRRKGHIPTQQTEVSEEVLDIPAHSEPREVRYKRAQLMHNLLIDPLSLNFGFVGLAVIIGWLILEGLIWIESVTWGAGNGFQLMGYVPLFPMALIGGIIVQLGMTRLGLETLIIRPLMGNIAGVALDVVIVTALASISLAVLGSNFVVFFVLGVAGIAWNIFAFLYLAPRLIPEAWFERGIGDMGQSMGVTATGILLLRMVDPDNRSGAFESFAYKQLLFEPIVGGGLFTAAAPALIAQFGQVAMLLFTSTILAIWLIVGFLLFGRQQKRA